MTENTGRLIFGCMGLGGEWTAPEVTPAATEHATRALRAALDAGITTFDHANIYGRGKAESVFGAVRAAHPDWFTDTTVQTKCGIRLGTPELGGRYDLSAAAVLESVTASLARLDAPGVDLLLLHRPDPLLNVGELRVAINELLASGRIGALGVSNMSAAQIDYLQEGLDVPIVVNQIEASLYRSDFAESGVLINHPEGTAVSFPHGTLEWCARNGVALQAWGPLAKGRYSQRTPEQSPADAATTDLVLDLARSYGVGPEAVVLGWLLKHPADISAVLGTANPGRIAASAGAETAAAAMTGDEWYALWTAARGRPLP
ncbi:aldo/keto reductase [Mycetocola spongiae]|uniref:aldo/keto reductase n=1 Tax=Mycetocola spongiae TaxID=2859226 RepID=UPI001CF4BF0C|nr:aldo/keto reductase [Mycetocola spongiae]UCR88846.1 aldo/keto reductase [Mycetocola spongiae]